MWLFIPWNREISKVPLWWSNCKLSWTEEVVKNLFSIVSWQKMDNSKQLANNVFKILRPFMNKETLFCALLMILEFAIAMALTEQDYATWTLNFFIKPFILQYFWLFRVIYDIRFWLLDKLCFKFMAYDMVMQDANKWYFFRLKR